MAEKICSVCGVDVAKRPRVKDASGRYFCEACHAKTRPTPSPRAPALPSTATADAGRVQRGAAGKLEMRRAAPGGAIGLAEDGATDEGRDSARGDGLETCPDCAMPIRKDSDLCVSCGFNRKTGRPAGALFDDGTPGPARRQKVCQKCGYELAGLRTAKCPECGHVNVPKSKRDLMERMPRRVTKWLWIAPLIVLGVWAAAQVGLDVSGKGSVLRAGVYLAGASMLGVPVYWALNLFWIDREEPWWGLVLGVIAVFAGGDLVTSLLIAAGPIFVGLYFWTFLLPLAVHGFLFKGVLDIEWKEAFAVAVPATAIAMSVGIVAMVVR